AKATRCARAPRPPWACRAALRRFGNCRTIPPPRGGSRAGPVCSSSGALGESVEVVVGVAELLRDRREAPERVAHLELLAHAHAAMELHRLLAHVAARVGDAHLGGGDDAPAPLGGGGGAHA